MGFKSAEEEATYQNMKSKLLDEVKKVFKPEFVNRVDELIVFKPLTKEDLYEIIEIEMHEVEIQLAEQEIKIKMDKESKDFIISKGFDSVFGARPLKRTIQKYLENFLAESIIKGEIDKTKTIEITVDKDKETLLFSTGK